jgi:hypothetical protein
MPHDWGGGGFINLIIMLLIVSVILFSWYFIAILFSRLFFCKGSIRGESLIIYPCWFRVSKRMSEQRAKLSHRCCNLFYGFYFHLIALEITFRLFVFRINVRFMLLILVEHIFTSEYVFSELLNIVLSRS